MQTPEDPQNQPATPEQPPTAPKETPGAAQIAISVLLLALCFLAAVELPFSSFEIGAATARILIAVLIAYGIRSIYVRTRKRTGTVWSPWIFLIALLVIAPLRVIGDERPPNAEQVRAVFIPLQGYTYQELPPAALEQVRSGFRDAFGEDSLSVVEGRRLVPESGQPSGVVVLGLDPGAMGDSGRDEAKQGFIDAGGTGVRDVEINGIPGFAGEFQGVSGVVMLHEDGYVFYVAGTDPSTLEEIARQLTAPLS